MKPLSQEQYEKLLSMGTLTGSRAYGDDFTTEQSDIDILLDNKVSLNFIKWDQISDHPSAGHASAEENEGENLICLYQDTKVNLILLPKQRLERWQSATKLFILCINQDQFLRTFCAKNKSYRVSLFQHLRI